MIRTSAFEYIHLAWSSPWDTITEECSEPRRCTCCVRVSLAFSLGSSRSVIRNGSLTQHTYIRWTAQGMSCLTLNQSATRNLSSGVNETAALTANNVRPCGICLCAAHPAGGSCMTRMRITMTMVCGTSLDIKETDGQAEMKSCRRMQKIDEWCAARGSVWFCLGPGVAPPTSS